MMTRFERENWLCNIQNTASEVAALYGSETVTYVLQKYGASSIESLNPVYYSEIFDELDYMTTDVRD